MGGKNLQNIEKKGSENIEKPFTRITITKNISVSIYIEKTS